ncbi:MAG: hypothetical protein P1U34_00175 [Coxiellaceae bacterium]|nr:hypothetical protein [Coxiellaceae bacterium]
MRNPPIPFQQKLASLVDAQQAGVTLTYSHNKLTLRAESDAQFLGASSEIGYQSSASFRRQLSTYGFRYVWNVRAGVVEYVAEVSDASDAVDAVSKLKRKTSSKRASHKRDADVHKLTGKLDQVSQHSEEMSKRLRVVEDDLKGLQAQTGRMLAKVRGADAELLSLQCRIYEAFGASSAPSSAPVSAPASSTMPGPTEMPIPSGGSSLSAVGGASVPAQSPVQFMADQGLFAPTSVSGDAGLEQYLKDLFGDDPTKDLPPTP